MTSHDSGSSLQVSALYTYPLKSGQGIAAPHISVEAMGPAGDRRFMVVDPQGLTVTQRTAPRLALVRSALAGNEDLTLLVDGQAVKVTATAETVDVRIWDDTVTAQRCVGADEALSRLLGRPVSIVHIAQDTVRPVDPRHATAEDRVGFADGFSFLVISEASLQDLNARLSSPVSMAHFRPNIVVSGAAPFAEDQWRRIRIGPVTFEVTKPCARCSMTTVDPNSGAKAGPEPLRTLASYRQIRAPESQEVFFGQNLVHRGAGVIRVGDKVEVLRSVSEAPTIESERPGPGD